MRDLVGKTCTVVFSLPFGEWPIAGSPAWAVVHDIHLSMVQMSERNGGEKFWVHQDAIRTIRPAPSGL